MSRTLEFRIPIAPTRSFFSNVRLAAASLAALGEPYSSAPIIVAIGDHADIGAVAQQNPWADAYPIRWFASAPDSSVDDGTPAGARGHRFPGFMRDRFPPDRCADIVVHCDADVCVMRRFDELLERVDVARPTVAGCMAHYTPFPGDAAENDARWRAMFAAAALPEPRLDHRYSLADGDYRGGAPPYFNAGFVVMNGGGWEGVVADIDPYAEVARVQLAAVGREFFANQIALSLAIAHRGIEAVPLGLEYNCPNEDKVLAHGVRHEQDVRAMHFLRHEEIDRKNFLAEPAAFAQFAAAPLQSRMNRHLRRHILSLTALCDALRAG
jgi:hypothetical protein